MVYRILILDWHEVLPRQLLPQEMKIVGKERPRETEVQDHLNHVSPSS